MNALDTLRLVGALGAVTALGWSGRPRTAGGDLARWARPRDVRPLLVRRPMPGRLVLGRLVTGRLVPGGLLPGRFVPGLSGRRLVAAERGHSVLVVGPTQSQKTTGFAIPAVLEWAGPVLAASVKADLAGCTMGFRRRRGTVWVFDPGGSTTLAASPWSPLGGASTWVGARRMAHSLTEAARPAAGSMADADFWYAAAAKLLAPLLLAAASSGRSMADVVRWVDEQEQHQVARALLDCAGADGALGLQAARATWGRDDRQRSAVYTTAETVLDAFADPAPRPAAAKTESGQWNAAASGALGGSQNIEPEQLLLGTNTLYLCAPAHEQRRLRPLFSALVTAVLDAAFERAAARGGALDPPLLVVLDEAANVAPVAELDTLASTAAGHGVQLVTVWQDLAQLNARYGQRAGSVVNNHRVKVFLSGIADPATLEHASLLIGDTESHQRTTTSDGWGRRSTTTAPVLRRLAPGDRLRRMPPGTAVAVSGHLPPVRLRLRPWWRRGDLRRKVETS